MASFPGRPVRGGIQCRRLATGRLVFSVNFRGRDDRAAARVCNRAGGIAWTAGFRHCKGSPNTVFV